VAAITHKSPKIAVLLADVTDDGIYARHYLGYFACFNRQLYYEAHDVLEELWLPIRGTPQARFYQGLIQMAGGFVHLQKTVTSGGRFNRIAPAARLFALALANFQDYPAHHAGIDLDAVRALCHSQREAIASSNETVNPWSPENAPQLAWPDAARFGL
jgi:predicted metal-dependent hydrolase